MEARRHLSVAPAVNVNRFHLGEPDGHEYSRNVKPTSRRAHGIILDGAKPAIQDHQASNPGICERG